MPRSSSASRPGGGGARRTSAGPSCSWRPPRPTTCTATCWPSTGDGWRGKGDLSDRPAPGSERFGVIGNAWIGIFSVDQLVDAGPGEVGCPKRIGVGLEIHLAADRKSTRLNSSHSQISYAVFCLKQKT